MEIDFTFCDDPLQLMPPRLNEPTRLLILWLDCLFHQTSDVHNRHLLSDGKQYLLFSFRFDGFMVHAWCMLCYALVLSLACLIIDWRGRRTKGGPSKYLKEVFLFNLVCRNKEFSYDKACTAKIPNKITDNGWNTFSIKRSAIYLPPMLHIIRPAIIWPP